MALLKKIIQARNNPQGQRNWSPTSLLSIGIHGSLKNQTTTTYEEAALCPSQTSQYSHTELDPRACTHGLIFYLMATLQDPWVGLCWGQLDPGLIPAAGKDEDAEMAHFRISLLNHRGQCGSPAGLLSTSWAVGQQIQWGGDAPAAPHPSPMQGVAQLPGVHSRVPILGRLPRPGCKHQPWPRDPSSSLCSSSRCAKTSWCEGL